MFAASAGVVSVNKNVCIAERILGPRMQFIPRDIDAAAGSQIRGVVKTLQNPAARVLLGAGASGRLVDQVAE